MTALHRTDFTFAVRLESDLHIGTGDHSSLEDLRGLAPEAGETSPQVSVVVRDHAGKPTIPPTAMKGVLRSAFERLKGRKAAEDLFGAPKLTVWTESGGHVDPVETGGPARLTLFAGRIDPKESSFPSTDNGARLPLISKESWSFVETHVAISRKSGTSDAQKLHNLEVVPAGTVFRFDGFVFAEQADASSILGQVLGLLAAKHGVNIGHGSADGAGRMVLEKGVVEITPVKFDGNFSKGERKQFQIAPIEEKRTTHRLGLTCKGPYLSLDPYAARSGSNRQNVLHALRRGDDAAVLWPSTVMGALRERAAWLAASAEPGADEWDDRFRKPSSWKSPEDLRPVERLFGVSGWRGLVRVQNLEHVASRRGRGEDGWPGLDIDPVSGGARDQALFFHDCFTDVAFELTLELEERAFGGVTYPKDTDRRLWSELLAEISHEGLLLGHGVSRGFGWFDVGTVSRAKG